MDRTAYANDQGSLSEISIVDTFTKLIFGEESAYDEGELKIIEVLKIVDSNVRLDNHREMGAYLRALGVQEMIKLVATVRRAILNGTRGDIAFRPTVASSRHSHAARASVALDA